MSSAGEKSQNKDNISKEIFQLIKEIFQGLKEIFQEVKTKTTSQKLKSILNANCIEAQNQFIKNY